MTDHVEAKRAAARMAAARIAQDTVVGLGSGSTAAFFVEALGERVRSGLRAQAIATSLATEDEARTFGIPTCTLDEHPTVDIAVDGADAVDPNLDLVKGFGGALLREKMVALAARSFLVIVDSSKIVTSLSEVARIPVEVVSFAWTSTAFRIERLGMKPTLRRASGGEVFVTDNGNYVLDVHVPDLSNPVTVATRLKSLTGVVEHGLFLGMAHTVFIGNADGTVTERMRERP